jgi:hypothetical protein
LQTLAEHHGRKLCDTICSETATTCVLGFKRRRKRAGQMGSRMTADPCIFLLIPRAGAARAAGMTRSCIVDSCRSLLIARFAPIGRRIPLAEGQADAAGFDVSHFLRKTGAPFSGKCSNARKNDATRRDQREATMGKIGASTRLRARGLYSGVAVIALAAVLAGAPAPVRAQQAATTGPRPACG